MAGEYQVVVKGHYPDASQTRMIYTVDADGATESDDIVAAAEYGAAVTTKAKDLCSNTHVFDAFDINKWNGLTWDPKASGTISSGTGTVGTEYSSNQNASVAVAKTARKKTRGRKFIPALAEAHTSNGQLVSAAQTLLTTFAAQWITAFLASNGVNIQAGVVSKVTNLFYPFIGVVIDSIIGSQRRRKPNVGI